jgi:hypothetical protein
MGRKKYKEEEKKIKRSMSIDPETIKILNSKNINISSLVNKLLKEHIENENL